MISSKRVGGIGSLVVAREKIVLVMSLRELYAVTSLPVEQCCFEDHGQKFTLKCNVGEDNPSISHGVENCC